jgi:hypothetical protein
MYNPLDTLGQYEMVNNHNVCDNDEILGQKFGSVVVLPALRDRIALRTGELLITIGQKMKAASIKHMRLTEEMA